jgi:RHS repeat-associated protein
MNLRLLGYFRSYKAIRALIIYRYLYEIYKNYQETLYQAESSFFDLAAWDNQNTQKIEQGGDTTKQKTATGVENFSPENAPGLEHPESQNCIGFKAVFIYDLRPINLFYFRARYYDPIMGRFLSVDPMGYQDSMNLYQAFKMNPINFLDPFGKWIASIHKEISMVGKPFAYDFFENKDNYLYMGWTNVFINGLMAGSVWPDKPTGNIGALKNVWDLTYEFPFEFGAEPQEKLNKQSLDYWSHFGPGQFLHAMQYGNRSKKMTKSMMIKYIINWILKAREILMKEKLDYIQGISHPYYIAGNYIGRAMHVIEDSFCPAHTRRDQKTMEILEFYNYGKQIEEKGKEWHEDTDVVNPDIPETEKYYKEAKSAVSGLYKIIFNPNQEDIRAELLLYLNKILRLK